MLNGYSETREERDVRQQMEERTWRLREEEEHPKYVLRSNFNPIRAICVAFIAGLAVGFFLGKM